MGDPYGITPIGPTRLHETDVKRLLGYYQEQEYGSRAHTLLAIAWYTGARLGAIRGLDLEDFNHKAQYLAFRHRPDTETPLKNGRDGERIIGVPPDVADVIHTYIEGHRFEGFDEYGRQPLLASQIGPISTNAGRAWMYLATVPCLYSLCPHVNDPATCEYLDYTHASECPSSRSPHQVRTSSITWQLNRGVPPRVVARRVNTQLKTIKRHYDKPTRREEFEQRRRQHVENLGFEKGENRRRFKSERPQYLIRK